MLTYHRLHLDAQGDCREVNVTLANNGALGFAAFRTSGLS